jgi:hypothetical protein
VQEGGLFSLICQQSFMTTRRYKALREKILKEVRIKSIVQLGAGSFGSAGGEKINNAVLTAEKSDKKSPIECWRILAAAEKKAAEETGIKSRKKLLVSHDSFQTIPGSPFSFWCPPPLADLFAKHPPFESKETQIICVNGLFTCNNKRFVRKHHEVSPDQKCEWMPYDKGGGHKWYRTTPFLIYWKNDGEHIRDYRAKRGQSRSLPGQDFYGQEGITYSYIGTKGFRARLLSPESIFDIASSSVFSSDIDNLYVLGLLNSSLMRFLLGVLNPTVNFQIGDLRKLPFAHPDQETLGDVVESVKEAVKLAKDLDSFDCGSPLYQGPVLARYAPELGQDFNKVASTANVVRKAFSQHLNHVKALNSLELELQNRIDQTIFDLYKVSIETRKQLLKDPWVASHHGPIARIPSLPEALDELSGFNQPLC